MLALGLAIRARNTADEGDIQALQSVEQRLLRELERFDTIKDAAAKIRRQIEVIDGEVATGTKNLQRIVGDAKKTLLALKVELREEEVERASPILLEPSAPVNDSEAISN